MAVLPIWAAAMSATGRRASSADDDYSASDYRPRATRSTIGMTIAIRVAAMLGKTGTRATRAMTAPATRGRRFYAAGYTGPGYYGSSPLRDSGRYSGALVIGGALSVCAWHGIRNERGRGILATVRSMATTTRRVGQPAAP
jgi:hypothetical protein